MVHKSIHDRKNSCRTITYRRSPCWNGLRCSIGVCSRAWWSIHLRIEDTDQARTTAVAEQMIIDSLLARARLGRGPDVGGEHGPYRQSERRDLYSQYAWQLVEQGHAFVCYRTPESSMLCVRRDLAGKSTALKPADLELSAIEQAARKGADAPFVIRMRVP